ncbi:Peptidylprolyl isomerase domain and wd repeat-containing protein 1 [Globisporangium polare]
MGCAESRNTVQPQGVFSVVTPGTSAASSPSTTTSTTSRIFNRNKNAPAAANKKHKPNALVPEPQGLPPVANGPPASLGDLAAATPAAKPQSDLSLARSMAPSVDAIANAKPASPPPSSQTSLAKGPSLLLLPTDKQNLTHFKFEELSIQFLKAVKNGDLAYMERVAQQAAKANNNNSSNNPTTNPLINIRGMWESTPLIYACQYCHPKAAAWLLEQGANVRLQNEKGVTPLLLASLEGMTAVVDWILKQYATAVISSTCINTDQQVQAPSSEPGSSDPVVSIDKQVGVVYNSAADLNIRLNPLLAAAMNGHVEIVAKLLAHKASVNFGVPVSAAVASSKQFALLLAAKFGHASVVRILVKHGADFATSDANGSHALLLACEASKEECAMELLRLLPATPVPSPLSEKGEDNERQSLSVPFHSNSFVAAWKQANSHGLTALHFAAANGLLSVVQSMLVRLQWRSDREFLNATSVNRRECALLMACRKRQSEVVQLLISVGADFELADRGGTTALQVLKRDKKNELVKLCESKKLGGATSDDLGQSDVAIESSADAKRSDEQGDSRRGSEATTATELAIEVAQDDGDEVATFTSSKQQYEEVTTKPQAKSAVAFDWDAALEPIISPAVMVDPASGAPVSNVSSSPVLQSARDASVVVGKPFIASGSSRTMSFAPNAIRATSGYEQQGLKPTPSEVASANNPLEEDTTQQQHSLQLERIKTPTLSTSDFESGDIAVVAPKEQEVVEPLTETTPTPESVAVAANTTTTATGEAQDAEDALAMAKAKELIKTKVHHRKKDASATKHKRRDANDDDSIEAGARGSDFVSRVNSVESAEECVTAAIVTLPELAGSESPVVARDDWDEPPSHLSEVGVENEHRASSTPLVQRQPDAATTSVELKPLPPPPRTPAVESTEEDAPSPKKERRKKKKPHSSKKSKQSSMSALPLAIDLQLESSSSPAQPPPLEPPLAS